MTKDIKINKENQEKSDHGKPAETKAVEVRAVLRYLKISPKKVRLIANAVKRMDAVAAVSYLKLVNKASSLPLLKLINSAIANGVNNFSLDKNNLYIKTITVDQGPSLKRWRPRAFGRATPIFKRSSHIAVILGEKHVSGKAKDLKHATKEESRQGVKVLTPAEMKKAGKTGKSKEAEESKKGASKGFTKKFFSRKTG